MSFDKKLVIDSFEAVKPHADEMVEHFYSTLFSNHPEARGLFTSVDMKAQRKALVASLAHSVENLNDEEHLTRYLLSLGERHVRYGVEEEHYAWVGEALVATLAYFFDENWTPEAEAAWVGCYTLMADVMKKGMKQSQPAFELISENETAEVLPFADMVRNHVKDLFKKALLEEMNGELMDFARQQAKEVLRTAIRKEIESEIGKSSSEERTRKKSKSNGRALGNGKSA